MAVWTHPPKMLVNLFWEWDHPIDAVSSLFPLLHHLFTCLDTQIQLIVLTGCWIWHDKESLWVFHHQNHASQFFTSNAVESLALHRSFMGLSISREMWGQNVTVFNGLYPHALQNGFIKSVQDPELMSPWWNAARRVEHAIPFPHYFLNYRQSCLQQTWNFPTFRPLLLPFPPLRLTPTSTS